MMDSIAFSLAGMIAVSGLSLSVYAALPKALFTYAERHGRFLGLSRGEIFADGTRAGEPPVGRIEAIQAG